MLGHELGKHAQLRLLALGLLGAPARAERLCGLEATLALALEHLELFVVVQRTLKLLLRPSEAGEQEPQRVAPLVVPGAHRIAKLRLEPRDQGHAGSPPRRPPRTCQWRCGIV